MTQRPSHTIQQTKRVPAHDVVDLHSLWRRFLWLRRMQRDYCKLSRLPDHRLDDMGITRDEIHDAQIELWSWPSSWKR